jgi:acyl carrier protein/NAD(P)-dependent dehydrogenase (short-subunit alcohol dehydrogenase family)
VVSNAAPSTGGLRDLEQSLARFSEQQREMLRVHEQYLNNQAEYFRIFYQLTQQQQTLLASGTLSPDTADNLTRNMTLFHDHQAETLRVHEQYLHSQGEGLQSFMALIREQYEALVPVSGQSQPNGKSNGAQSVKSNTLPPAPPSLGTPAPAPVALVAPVPAKPAAAAPITPAPAPVVAAQAAPVTPSVPPIPAKPAPAADDAQVKLLSEALLKIVSEKTGYPAEMLELGMDLEADLGVDSIKRVEILGAMREQFPALPQLKAEELGELRTLQQIVDYMRAQMAGTPVTASVPASAPVVPASPNGGGTGAVAPRPAAVEVEAVVPVPVMAPPAAVTTPTTSGVSAETLSAALLVIVSEKTGYPAEMLEMGMDLEADLGIDSIKRVEILGAMRDQFPDLPQLKAEELGELRTLQQIVDYMRAQMMGTAVPTPAPITAPAAVPVPAPQPVTVPAPATPAPAPVVMPAAPAPASIATPTTGGVSAETLSAALLVIVSEKTGYPAEMLEMGMDLEADLGIDSIKRVEILGAMRDQFPDLPQLKAEELGELRTLQQIVDYMRAQMMGAAVPTPAPITAPVLEPVAEAVTPAPVAAVSAVPDVAAVSAVSAETLSAALLVIVSEKTGYPAEMLEMGMDLEADLGIDSIKRVEILGAMRDQFPALPQLKAEELGELRTLQQIVDYMRAQMAGSAANGAAPAPQEALIAGQPAEHDIPRSDVRLKYLPEPDYLDFDLPKDTVCVITDDGSPLTANIAQRLAARGWKLVVLAFPQSVIGETLSAAFDRIVLPDMSEAGLKAALDSLSARFGEVGAFIHVNPVSELFARGGKLFVEQEKAIVKHVFLMAKYLKESLNQAACAGRSGFMTVARLDGALGLSQNANFGAIASGFFGLTKTLNLEWEAVFCRAVDLAADLPVDEAAQHVIAELHDPNRMLVEVAYSAEGRVTLVAEQANLNETRA